MGAGDVADADPEGAAEADGLGLVLRLALRSGLGLLGLLGLPGSLEVRRAAGVLFFADGLDLGVAGFEGVGLAPLKLAGS